MKKESRFEEIHSEGGVLSRKTIYVDTETGVNYLYIQDGYSGGLTPLLGADGKPVVTTINVDL